MSVRRISTGRIERSGSWVFTQWEFFASKQISFRFGRRGYERLRAERDEAGVARIGRKDDRVMWWAKPDEADESDESGETEFGLYWATPEMSAEDVSLVIWGRRKRHGSQIDRLRKRHERDEEPAPARREHIPADLQDEVFRRDEGRCVRCGSEEELQFDHIIPVSKGGGSTAENLQVMCGPCNRAKSDVVGG